MAGAPKGNTNSSSDNRLWANTIRKAVIQSDPKKLMKIAQVLIDKAAEGDMAAMKELGDRLDGKAAQSVNMDANVNGNLTVEIVRFGQKNG